VSQRRREIGIRLALGAAPSTVRRLVLRQGLALVGGGLALGVGAALGVSGVLRASLPGISPRDPLTFGAVVLALAAVAVLALWGPARRASRLDPAVALRID
jgi:ABC-type antimicrobial peptide transport system permease subunit